MAQGRVTEPTGAERLAHVDLQAGDRVWTDGGCGCCPRLAAARDQQTDVVLHVGRTPSRSCRRQLTLRRRRLGAVPARAGGRATGDAPLRRAPLPGWLIASR
ncbi:MAG: hypothetical protein ACP5MJ_20350 [Roseiflexus sp.]